MSQRALSWALRWTAAVALALCAGAVSFADRFGVDLSGLSAFGLVFATAALTAALGAFVFLDGGRLGPRSILSLSFALFVFLPATYFSVSPGLSVYEVQALLAAGVAFFSILFVCPRGLRILMHSYANIAGDRVSPSFVIFLFGVMFSALILVVWIDQLSAFWEGAWVGSTISLFVLGVVSMERNRPLLSLTLWMVSLSLFVIWYFVFFTGFSRINLAAFVFSFILVFLLARPSRSMKIFMILFLPFGLAWGALQRDGASSVFEALQRGEGLSSVFAPFRDYALTLEKSSVSGLFPWYHWVDQVVVSVLFWVPRDWWPSKPDGFGFLLTNELRSHLAPFGHSSASSILGEMTAYFGLLGPLMAVFVVSFLVVMVTQGVAFIRRSLGDLIGLVVGAYASAQIMSLVWMGVFTFSVRVGSLVIGLLVFFVWLVLWRLIRYRERDGVNLRRC